MRQLLPALLAPPAPPETWPPPTPTWIDLGLPVLTMFPFDGAVRRTIIDWKEEARLDARTCVHAWFTDVLAVMLRHLPGAMVAGIPSSPGANRVRGWAPLTEVLTEAVPPVRLSSALVAARPRADQAGLSRRSRVENLAHALRWEGAAPACVLIVDDILTTGATLREAARAARAAGALDVVALALARRECGGPVAPWGLGLG